MYRYKETAKAVWNRYSRDNNSYIEVNMEIWTPDMKLEKKSCQIMLKEMIPGKIAISTGWTTQAIISLVKKGHVFIKIACGCNGNNSEKLVKIIKYIRPEKIQDIYKMALENKFGCRECLVVMDNENIIFKGDGYVDPLYRETFNDPSFNPRWNSGIADIVTILKMDNPEWVEQVLNNRFL